VIAWHSVLTVLFAIAVLVGESARVAAPRRGVRRVAAPEGDSVNAWHSVLTVLFAIAVLVGESARVAARWPSARVMAVLEGRVVIAWRSVLVAIAVLVGPIRLVRVLTAGVFVGWRRLRATS